jgi:hypothetical protein
MGSRCVNPFSCNTAPAGQACQLGLPVGSVSKAEFASVVGLSQVHPRSYATGRVAHLLKRF